jgi:regulator of PEP synthase PpsR (kinase-PPPase family)
MRSLEATVFDVTQKSLEEIAQEILDRLRSR